MSQWFTAEDLAVLALDGIPVSKRGVQKLAEREGWADHEGLCRKRRGRGGGLEYHLDCLPMRAQLDYAARHVDAERHRGAAVELAPQGDMAVAGGAERDARLAVIAVADGLARSADLPRRAADPLFARLYNDGEVAVSPWVRDLVGSVSPRSLARWRGAYNRDANALAFDRSSARRGTSVLDRAEGGEVRAHVLALIGRRPHLSAKHIRNVVISEFGEPLSIIDPETGELTDAAVPPVRTFQRQISVWKRDYANELMRFGDPDRHKSTVRFALRVGRPMTHVNELWQVDASPADVMTTEGRHHLYAAIDVYSRRARFLVSKTPTAAGLGLLIRRCILDWGVPAAIKSDNGADFVARDIERLLAYLGVEHDLCAPFHPEQKGMVERLIGTSQRDLMATLPGFTGHSVADRKRIESQKAFGQRLGQKPAKLLGVDLSPAELQAELDQWVARYEQTGHGGLRDRTPLEVAAACTHPIRAISDQRALDVLLAPVASGDGLRKVTKLGVKVDHEDYITRDVMVGETVLVRHDPADLGRVMLFSPDGEAYLGEAVCPELAGLDPQETIAKARAMQKAREDGLLADIRRRERKIGPRDVLEAQKRADTAALLAFPKPEIEHSTPEIAAAAAVDAEAPTELSGRAAELHDQLTAELASPTEAVPPNNITPLRAEETARQRFRRARDVERRIEAGEEVSADEALWLGGYRESAEYRAEKHMFEAFGEAALR